MTFKEKLDKGRAGESEIALYLRSIDWYVLPAYEKIIENEMKGPRIYAPNNKELIATDFFIFRGERARWVEVKHKTGFSWYRITQEWTTGIDKDNYRDYLEIDKKSPWPVHLLLLHEGGHTKDSPEESPAGLFQQSLDYLSKNIHHTSDRYGPHGMVYWSIKSFNLLVTLKDFKKQIYKNNLLELDDE